MGGSVSAGESNDELIDHLVEANYIKTPLVQRVFRAVDRGNYYDISEKQNAYKDVSWKKGNLHLSAPCVYSVVLENLNLKPGLSFLNIGSGTGYFSTVAGLVLGTYGVNHGIEFYREIVEYAKDRLEEFLKGSNGVDMYDFCEPIFTVGNCLNLDNSCQQYDRIYCGASCPEEYEINIKNLLKVGGILIIPVNDKLLKITRTSDTTWQAVKVITVGFAPLLPPDISKETHQSVRLSDPSPPPLQHICRSYIRSIFRDSINKEHPNLQLKLTKKDQRPKRQFQRIVLPFYDDNDLSASQSTSEIEFDEAEQPEFKLGSRIPSRMSLFLEDFLRRHAELQLLREMHDQSSSSGEESQPAVTESSDENNDIGMPSDEQSSKMSSLIEASNVGQSSSSDDASNFSKPPSQSTRSRKKRKPEDTSELPSTSSEASTEPPTKLKHTSTDTVWNKLENRKEDCASPDTGSSCSSEESYSDLMAQKILQLPLPHSLLSYLNYGRSNL